MHIFPYYKKKTIQRFFLGVFVGALIAYCILIFMYGRMYEQLLERNYALQAQITEIKRQNEALLQDNKEIDDDRKERLTINRIEILIQNAPQLRLDRLIITQLNEIIINEINHIIGQPINTIAESSQLLQSTVENKAFSVDNFTYYFQVEKLIISQTVHLTLKAKRAN